MSCCASSKDRFSAVDCERIERGGVPCAGGACPAPGGTPTFLSLSPLAAQKRRARLTGRLPHGPRCKPVDSCCALTPDSYWEESLPWKPSKLCSEPQHDWRDIGEPYWRSQFRSLTRCGFLRTKKACECGDWSVDQCRRCEVPPCCERMAIELTTHHCHCNECEDPCCTICKLSKNDDTGGETICAACDAEKSCTLCVECNGVRHRCGREHSDGPKAVTPLTRSERRNLRWHKKRHSFAGTRARAANPSGQTNPISEQMRPATRALSFGQQRSAMRQVDNCSDCSKRDRFTPAVASRRFVGDGNPDEFCNSLRCRFAANGPVEQRAAICQFGTQSRR